MFRQNFILAFHTTFSSQLPRSTTLKLFSDLLQNYSLQKEKKYNHFLKWQVLYDLIKSMQYRGQINVCRNETFNDIKLLSVENQHNQ